MTTTSAPARPDLVVGDAGPTSGHIWLNDGHGTFGASGDVEDGFTVIDAALGDVDGDGDLDIVQTGYYGTFGPATRVLLNYGGGTFLSSPYGTALGYGGYQVELGDLNGDGFLDVAVAGGPSGGHTAVLLSNVSQLIDGHFTSFASVAYAYGGDSRAVAIADVDGDGDLDVVSNSADWGLYIVRNQGGNSFSYSEDSDNLGFDPGNSALAVGDVDGDGRADILTESTFGDAVIFAGRPYASFSAVTLSEGADAERLALADIDGDGKPRHGRRYGTPHLPAYDVPTHNVGRLRQGISPSTTSSSVSFGYGTYATDVQAVDIDGDGDLDIVVTVHDIYAGGYSHWSSAQRRRRHLHAVRHHLRRCRTPDAAFGELDQPGSSSDRERLAHGGDAPNCWQRHRRRQRRDAHASSRSHPTLTGPRHP